jgi:hypothetical protein
MKGVKSNECLILIAVTIGVDCKKPYAPAAIAANHN